MAAQVNVSHRGGSRYWTRSLVISDFWPSNHRRVRHLRWPQQREINSNTTTKNTQPQSSRVMALSHLKEAAKQLMRTANSIYIVTCTNQDSLRPPTQIIKSHNCSMSGAQIFIPKQYSSISALHVQEPHPIVPTALGSVHTCKMFCIPLQQGETFSHYSHGRHDPQRAR